MTLRDLIRETLGDGYVVLIDDHPGDAGELEKMDYELKFRDYEMEKYCEASDISVVDADKEILFN